MVTAMPVQHRFDRIVRRLSVWIIGLSAFGVSGTFVAASIEPVRHWLTASTGTGASAYTTARALGLSERLYEHTPVSVVVVARPDCPAFLRSQESLERVARLANTSVTVSLVVDRVVPVGGPESIGLPASSVYRYEPSALGVGVVPTVLVLDRRGDVRFVHEGVLDAERAEGVIRLVEQLQRTQS